MNAIAAERRWGLSGHGGKRKGNGDADATPAAGGGNSDSDSADGVRKKQPDCNRNGNADHAVAEPPVGDGGSAAEVRKRQPDGKRKRSPSGVNNAHVAALAPPLATGSATLSLVAGSASGGIRLCTGVNMGYMLIGLPLGNEPLARHSMLFGRTGTQTPVANMSL